MQEIIAQLRSALSEKLTPSRYEHTISVSFTAAALAMRYGCDLDKAELAGLLPLLALFWYWRPPPAFEKEQRQEA